MMTAAQSVFGYRIVSALPMPRVVSGLCPRGSIVVGRASEPHSSRGALVHRHEEGGNRFTLERSGDRLLARCSASGSYLLDPGAASVEVWPSASPSAVEHRLLSMALPLLLAERGDVALHASALLVEDRAIAFAGRSGRGKSTIASVGTSLGHRLVAEDGIVATVERSRIVVWPGPLGIRAGDARTFVPTTRERHAAGPAPLAAVAVLRERASTRLSWERLGRAAAVPAILSSLIFGGSDRLHEALAAAARIAERVPVYQVSMPDTLDALPEALETTIGVVRAAR